MTRDGIGVLAALGVAVALGYSSIAVHAQQPSSTGAPAVHSVTITLAPGGEGKACEIKPLSPEVRGVYRADTIVWHVENGCGEPVTVSVGDITLVEPNRDPAFVPFEDGQKWSKNVSVESRRRDRISAKIVADPKPGTRYVVEYTVRLSKGAGSPADLKGWIVICPEPPCGPPIRPPVK